jgi:formate-dependent nitrite reductase membrane component NrfD
MSARPDIGTTRAARAGGPSPYGRPVIKEPIWKPEIPFYLYTGGLAGASAGLAWLSDRRGDHGVARRAWATALAAGTASPALLVADLGVPARFLNMLRLFKVTSPMSVGSWILAAFGTATAPAAADALSGGRLGAAGRGAQATSALLGLPLASYTAALLSNTAIPAWHEARHDLPFVFVAGAAMSAGAMSTALAPVEEAAVARRLAIGGGVAELALTQAMEKRLERRGVGAPYHEGAAGVLTKLATALTAAGVGVLAARGSRSRTAAIGAAALMTAGAIAERWAVFRAGFQSAARPQDTVDPQRKRIADGETSGAARREPEVAPARVEGDGHRPGGRPVPPGSPAIRAAS